MFRVASFAAVLTVLIPLTSRAQGGRKPARAARPAPTPTAAAPVADTATFSQLRYRYIGPVGNRVAAVAGVAGDASTYYAGAASGGIWKTNDGGIHWQPIFDDQPVQSIGALAVAPSDPNVVWAGTGEAWIRSHISIGNGIYKSTDAGKTWQHMGLDLTGRIGRVVIHPTNPDIVFAAALGHSYGPQQERGVYRTTDGRQTYYTRVAVAPDRDNEAYFLCASFSKTLDGGETTTNVPFPQSPGGDNHDMWIDPTDGNRMVVGNDGQVAISTNRGKSWDRVQLPIAQMYHATVDNQIPYYVMGNRQDGPSSRGPSNSKIGGFGGGGGGGGTIPRGEWHSVGGGESGWATPDPTDPNIIWSTASGSGSVGGIVVRYDERTRQAQHVEIWPQSTIGFPAADVKYRFVWTMPLTISPHDHNRVYAGSQFVHLTKDRCRSG